MKKILTFLSFLFALVLSAQNGWIQRTSLPADGRHRATGCAIGNKGYIGLGHVNGLTGSINYDDWWEYDPASDSWTQKANYPTDNYGAVCFVANGKAFVGGGAFLGPEFYAYSPVTNTWTSIANCLTNPGDQGAMSINNKGYVLSTNQLYEYDPVTNQWTQKATAPAAFSIWSVAFSTGSSGYVKNMSMLYEYKPLNDQWLQRATFPGVNTNGGAAMMHNGKAYVVSGYVGSLNNVTEEVWEYNPGNNVWTRMADFPGNSRRFTVAFTINNKGFFGTGTHGINLNDFWELDEPVGVNEQSKGAVNVFPSPADESVEINFSSLYAGDEFEIMVYDISGLLVRELRTEQGVAMLSRNGLPSGMYMFVAVSNGINHSGKIIFR